MFRADSLPADALTAAAQVTAASLGLADGTYTVEVSMEGGSGRVTVESPATLTVKDQKAVATVVWSSPNYDYMKVGEEKFLPVNQGGETSMFEIPVTVFDRKMAVSADTTAMSTPHEIEYTLQFDSASIKAESVEISVCTAGYWLARCQCFLRWGLEPAAGRRRLAPARRKC